MSWKGEYSIGYQGPCLVQSYQRMSAWLLGWTALCNAACWSSRPNWCKAGYRRTSRYNLSGHVKSFWQRKPRKTPKEATSVWFWREPANMARIVPAQSIPQGVTTMGATSSPLSVTSGVPQGSILGPILFLLYVNSLPDAIRSSQIAAFADDTKVFRDCIKARCRKTSRRPIWPDHVVTEKFCWPKL